MKSDPFLNWKLGVWPDSYQIDSIGLSQCSSMMMGSAGNGQIWHQSFAIGFFGFHYIHAANENDHFLQIESLQILRKLVEACYLDQSFLNELKISKKQTYFDFRENVIRKVSLALGDAQGGQSQRAVELGYGLAAVYACFVGVLNDNDSGKTESCLRILKNWISDLLKSTEQTGVPEKSLQSLVKVKGLLLSSKTRPTANKCRQILKLVLNNLLSSTTAVL